MSLPLEVQILPRQAGDGRPLGEDPQPELTFALLSLAEIRCLAEEKSVVSVTTDGAVIRCLSAAGGRAPEPILVGNRFPRLTVRDPLRKLKEIRGFLSRLPAPDVR